MKATRDDENYDGWDIPYLNPEDDSVDRKVLRDKFDQDRAVVVTDGHWLEVGIDPANGKCIGLPLSSEENYYTSIRQIGTGSLTVPAPKLHVKDEYTISVQDRVYRVFSGDDLVLRDTDHEFSILRSAYKFAKDTSRVNRNINEKAEVVIEEFTKPYHDYDDIAEENTGVSCNIYANEELDSQLPLYFIESVIGGTWETAELTYGEYDVDKERYRLRVSFDALADYERLADQG